MTSSSANNQQNNNNSRKPGAPVKRQQNGNHLQSIKKSSARRRITMEPANQPIQKVQEAPQAPANENQAAPPTPTTSGTEAADQYWDDEPMMTAEQKEILLRAPKANRKPVRRFPLSGIAAALNNNNNIFDY